MPKKKTTKKRAPKKTTKKRAPKKTTKRRTKAKPSDHIARAHKSVVKVLGTVDAGDAKGLAALAKLVHHAHEEARTRGHR